MSKKFKYTYSALDNDERKEVEYIQSQYMAKDEKTLKLERLIKLDRRVKMIPECIGIILGVVGLLIFGLGFTMVLEWQILLWGVIVSLFGCVPIALAYFGYQKAYNKLKSKYADEIISLSEQLLGEEKEETNEKEEI